MFNKNVHKKGFLTDLFIQDMEKMNMDVSIGTLMGVAIVSGGIASDLIIRQMYWLGLAFLAFTAVCVFSREYFKVN